MKIMVSIGRNGCTVERRLNSCGNVFLVACDKHIGAAPDGFLMNVQNIQFMGS